MSWLWILTALAVLTQGQLQRVVFLHRHGARLPMSIINGSVECAENGCGLTDQGILQGRALGEYLRETYSTALGLTSTYNSSLVMTKSTSVPRVVQTAFAALDAWFDSETPPLPFVDFVASDDDILMRWWDSWPSWRLLRRFSGKLEELRQFTRELLGQNNLDVLSAWSGNNCTAIPAACAYAALDSWLCNVSNGAAVEPLVEEMSNMLTQYGLQLFNVLLGYHSTDDYDVQSGGFGYHWAVEALSRLRNGTPTLPEARVFHYAAHDWTLYAVYAALGVDAPTPIPPFVDAVFLESHTGPDGRTPHVRALRGWPSQTPGAATFTAAPLVVRCTSESGQEYNSSEGDCPLDDLARFVESRKPASEWKTCWIPQGALVEANCAMDGVPSSGECLFYRQRCPQVPCGSMANAQVDPAKGFACVALQAPPATNVNVLVGMGLGVILAGIGMGFGCGRVGARFQNRYQKGFT